MGFITRIMKAVDVLTEDESVEKGNDFEKYVKNLFDNRYFVIEQWSTDINRKHDTLVEADMFQISLFAMNLRAKDFV